MLGGAGGRVDYQLGVAHRATDGAFRDRLPEPDRFDQQSVDVAGAWFVTGGARIDENAHYGTVVNPKLPTGGYPLPYREGTLSSVKVSANVGRGIQNPSFFQLYGGQ